MTTPIRKTKNTPKGMHYIRGYEVYWVFREVVRISKDGVLFDLYYHDCRHGGDGYSRMDNLHLLSIENIGCKLRSAVDPDNDLYILREVTPCRS